MTERDAPETNAEPRLDLPLQPTGSGVADLEIAYEQMKLAADEGIAGTAPDGRPADMDLATPPDGGESEAHPS